MNEKIIGFQPGATAGGQKEAVQGQAQTQPVQQVAAPPRFVCLRTALVPKDEGIVKRIPETFKGETVEEILNFALDDAETDEEKQLAESIRKELRAEACAIVINEKAAKLSDRLQGFLAEREHLNTEGDKRTVIRYMEADVEVASVNKGGSA